MQEIKYKVDPNVPGIENAKFGNAGFIIKASQSKTLIPGVSVPIPTGVTFQLPDCTEGQTNRIQLQIVPLDELAKKDVDVTSGMITGKDYDKPVEIRLKSSSKRPFKVTPGMAIAMLVPVNVLHLPAIEVDEIEGPGLPEA